MVAVLWRNGGKKKNGSSEIPGRLPEGNDNRSQKGPTHNPIKMVAPKNPVMPAQPGPALSETP